MSWFLHPLYFTFIDAICYFHCYCRLRYAFFVITFRRATPLDARQRLLSLYSFDLAPPDRRRAMLMRRALMFFRLFA